MGHPEHDLLFIATQVARAAGLKNPKWFTQVGKVEQGTLQARALEPLVRDSRTLEPIKATGPRWRDSWLFPEALVYQMLLRGHAPASEPFRKWVTEVVLPSIRKTGKFEKTLDLIRGSPMMATLSPAPLVRAPRPKATGSLT
ncbi:BRO-N domain-containing protein [Stutzerimonas stutzeri]|uniref:BRO-N domain-containing protein n=2 Tax=Stutzerimonas stutzeri TaxID=316 RepID=UPI0006AC8F88|nr:hypothetical protein KVH38_06250 [Stutzerimonas stutzeri]